MSYRFMRIIVFFDLPVQTAIERKTYRNFRKHLVKNGFFMIQESVYCRMALNQTAADKLVDSIRRNKPQKGLVQILTVTEKQFEKMEIISGEFKSDLINSEERILFL